MARTRCPGSPGTAHPKRLWKVAALSGMASYLDAALIVSISVNLAIYRDSYDMGVWMAGAISAIVTGCIAVGSLVGGRLADLFGRRRVYNLDILCFALGAVVITLAPNDIMLLVGVLVAGLAAGADLPTSLAVVSDAAPADGPGQARRLHPGHVDAGHRRRHLPRLRPVDLGHDRGPAHHRPSGCRRAASPGSSAPVWSWPTSRGDAGGRDGARPPQASR